MSAAAARRGNAQRDERLPDWREYLNSRERVDLESLEKNAQHLDEQRRLLTAQIMLHRNRCVQRRRAALAEQALGKGAA